MTKPIKHHVHRIVSGGQTGVDRGALDAALILGLPHGGWCPRDRLAEDGRIPEHYQLRELESPHYRDRTRQNVIDSDGTLILYRGLLQGGTELTRRLAVRFAKPCLTFNLDSSLDSAGLEDWLSTHQISVLNVAGPRESSVPGIAATTRELLVAWLG